MDTERELARLKRWSEKARGSTGWDLDILSQGSSTLDRHEKVARDNSFKPCIQSQTDLVTD